jgi:hypothetical protein
MMMNQRPSKEELEERKRRKAIISDRDTIPMEFGATEPFDPIDNPGAYADDPLWKRFWKTEGIRALNSDGTIITDAMERFRVAFELGYLACRRIEGGRS